MSLEIGKAYEWDGWLFVVVSAADEGSVNVLCLTDFGWRNKTGDVCNVRHVSVVGPDAQVTLHPPSARMCRAPCELAQPKLHLECDPLRCGTGRLKDQALARLKPLGTRSGTPSPCTV